MSKERLEEIKEHFAHCMDEGLLFSEQEEKLLEELYEQAERNLTAQETIEMLGESLKQSIEQNKRYYELLESIHTLHTGYSARNTGGKSKHKSYNT